MLSMFHKVTVHVKIFRAFHSGRYRVYRWPRLKPVLGAKSCPRILGDVPSVSDIIIIMNWKICTSAFNSLANVFYWHIKKLNRKQRISSDILAKEKAHFLTRTTIAYLYSIYITVSVKIRVRIYSGVVVCFFVRPIARARYKERSYGI